MHYPLEVAPRKADPFEVHAIVYGGVVGPILDSYSTLDEAEAMHFRSGPCLPLVVLGPGASGEPGQKLVCSERDSSGRWKRLTVARPPTS